MLLNSSIFSPSHLNHIGRYCRSGRLAMAIRRTSVFRLSPATRCSISPEKLVDDGLISASEIEEHPECTDHKVNYGAVTDWKNQLLAHAYESFERSSSIDLRGQFETFCRENASWLDDYAYRSIKGSQGQDPWYRWPDPLKSARAKSIAKCERAVIRTNEGTEILSIPFFSAVGRRKRMRKSQRRQNNR